MVIVTGIAINTDNHKSRVRVRVRVRDAVYRKKQ